MYQRLIRLAKMALLALNFNRRRPDSFRDQMCKKVSYEALHPPFLPNWLLAVRAFLYV
jgi:hypothetical protein